MVDLTVGRERRVPSAGLTEVMGGKEEKERAYMKLMVLPTRPSNVVCVIYGRIVSWS